MEVIETTETKEIAIRQCQDESCTFNMGGLHTDWNVCPECGTPVGKKEEKEESTISYYREADEDKDKPEPMIKDCQNETCDLVIPKNWEFCPGCGFPQGDVEERPIILNRFVAMLALYKLDPYVFKLFMFIYFETAGSGIDWKRLKQEELEKECSISHPKVLKSIKELKADSGAETDDSEDAAEKLLHWITQESKTERWSKRQGYGLHEDMDDSERLKELLKPYLDARRKRNGHWY